jgi:hypothetical protein
LKVTSVTIFTHKKKAFKYLSVAEKCKKVKKKNNKLNWNHYQQCRTLAYSHNVSQIKQQSEDMVCKTQKSIYPLNINYTNALLLNI